MYKRVKETVKGIREKINSNAKIGIVLGSGLGDLVEFIDDQTVIKYNEVPNFPVSTVEGHAGQLVFGKIAGVEVMAMQGRFHYYEGYEMKEVAYPQYVMKEFGIKKMIVSNAAGGVNPEFKPGDLMIISDHLNLFGDNPLIGHNDKRFGPRFPDMSNAYKNYMIDIAKKVAKKIDLDHQEGVYAGMTGPYYETGAEINYISTIGADSVGMSTVPEVIAANYLGIDVLGISCITNMATGIAKTAHSHEDVVKTAKKAGENFCKWVVEIIKEIG
ncbi:MAG: purine-nucleoside phosphorylase [Fusobacteriota bacterium]